MYELSSELSIRISIVEACSLSASLNECRLSARIPLAQASLLWFSPPLPSTNRLSALPFSISLLRPILTPQFIRWD
jgi:hypothetical protein